MNSPKASRSEGNQPLVTISLVTFNGIRWLAGCLATVQQQTLADFELLVLDNSSTDGSVDWLRREAAKEPRMKLTESPDNLGFAAAHNRHIFAAAGAFVLLLNQDVELDSDFLAHAIEAFDGRPKVGAVQGRLRRLGSDGERLNMLDTTGLEMHRDRRVVARRQGELESERDLVPGPVWGADGPAPVYRRQALLGAREPRTGGGWEVLDEDFFMYKEDVDLAWRMRLLGWQVWYEPSALGWHARGAGARSARALLDIARSNRTIPGWVKAMSWRNQRLMQLKNDHVTELKYDLPWIALRELFSIVFVMTADQRRLLALPSALKCIPPAVRKHRYIHSFRPFSNVSGSPNTEPSVLQRLQ